MFADPVLEFAVVAFVAVVVAVFVRQRGMGIAVPLVVTGLVLGLLPFGPDAPPDPEVVLVAVLAPLVFGEALQSSYLDLRKVSRPILALAIGLVVVTTAAIGGMLWALGALSLATAFALGAILAPTDAVAVSAAAKRAALPRRLVSVLEGESLVNDGTGLTLLRVAVVTAVAGSATVPEVGGILGLALAGGVGIGLLAGWVLVLALRRGRDSVAANGLVLVAPFPIYLIAEEVHGSGILSVVIAALMVAHAMSSDSGFSGRLQAGYTWRQVTFLLQALAFTLLGLELPTTLVLLSDGERRSLLFLVPLVVTVLIVTRSAFVAIMALSRRRRRRREGTPESVVRLEESWRGWGVVAWAGTRGPVSGLAAFSLPLAISSGAVFPERDLVIAVALCVVVVTVLLSTTLAPVARVLRIPADDDAPTLLRVRASLARVALDRLGELVEEAQRKGQPLSTGTVSSLMAGAERRADLAVQALELQAAVPSAEQRVRLAAEMIESERVELIRLRDDEGLPDALMRQLMAELDARQAGLLKG